MLTMVKEVHVMIFIDSDSIYQIWKITPLWFLTQEYCWTLHFSNRFFWANHVTYLCRLKLLERFCERSTTNGSLVCSFLLSWTYWFWQKAFEELSYIIQCKFVTLRTGNILLKAHHLNNSRQCLKMLGLYLYTLIIGHKSYNMLSPNV